MNEVFNQEMRFRQFEETFDVLLEMKEQCQSEAEDDRIDEEITKFIWGLASQ